MLTSLAPFDGDTILPLDDARVHLNLTAADDHHDAAVRSAREAAISWAESYTGHSFEERQFLWSVDQFKSRMPLPRGPVSAVDEVSYYDSNGDDTALDAEDWYAGNGIVSAAYGTTWPYANGLPGGVRITFTAGYGTPDDIPENLMAAMKLAMTAFFEDRSNPDLAGAMRVADQIRPVL
jgi:uncharacterized phiE125 gp8 family phage protein